MQTYIDQAVEKFRALLTEQIAQFEIQHYFAAILGLGDIYAGSKEEIGRQYLQSCGIAPEETLMIGDTLHDAEVAQALSCRCILASGGHQADKVLQQAGCEVAGSVKEAAMLAIG